MSRDVTNQNLIESKEPDKINLKKVFIVTAICSILIIIVVVGIILIIKENLKSELNVTVDTIYPNIPNNTKIESSTYLPNGKILICYAEKNHQDKTIAIINDDGTELKEIIKSNYRFYEKSNGFRMMPFTDGKRVLLGDSILECEPSIDNCKNPVVLKVQYPDDIVNDKTVMFIWSEIVISQDSKYIAWTTLSTKFGAINFIGELKRENDRYLLTNVQIISNLELTKSNDGIIEMPPVRGGEIKQFVSGGTALTVAGSENYGIAKSMWQDLNSDRIIPLSHEPGYDETTILSPDEKLGVTMSTRFSPNTNFAILGLVPLPNGALITSKMNRYVYTFAVTNVRNGKNKGNVGPVLTEIEKSAEDPSYHGIPLHQDNWTFMSPISWNPSNLKVSWMETNPSSETHIRVATIHNYKLNKNVPTRDTPSNIKYALDFDEYNKPINKSVNGKLIGKQGEIQVAFSLTNSSSYYNNFSDDDKTFYNGIIEFHIASNGEASLSSNINITGQNKGEMDFRITFSPSNELLFDLDSDNKPKSYGHVKYNGKTIDVETYRQH